MASTVTIPTEWALLLCSSLIALVGHVISRWWRERDRQEDRKDGETSKLESRIEALEEARTKDREEFNRKIYKSNMKIMAVYFKIKKIFDIDTNGEEHSWEDED